MVLIVAVGALVWTRHHWSAWPAAAALTGGVFFFVVGALELRGYRNPALVWGTAGLAALVAAAVLLLRNRSGPAATESFPPRREAGHGAGVGAP